LACSPGQSGHDPNIPVWAARPIAPDFRLIAPAYKLCIEEHLLLNGTTGATGRSQLVVQDQRGPDAALFIWISATDEAACMVMRRPDGSFSEHALAGGSREPPGNRLMLSFYDGDEPPQVITGQTGRGRHVLVDLDDGTSLQATTGAGRFGAWWPSASKPVRLRSFDDAGTLVEMYEIRPIGQRP
jgi:hypothetical protein